MKIVYNNGYKHCYCVIFVSNYYILEVNDRYDEKRITDSKVPLVLDFEDGDRKNHNYEEMNAEPDFTSGRTAVLDKVLMRCFRGDIKKLSLH